MKTLISVILIGLSVLTSLNVHGHAQGSVAASVNAQARAQVSFIYVDPQPGAQFVSPGTTIAVRTDAKVQPSSISAARFRVVGEQSGVHTGRVVLADDQQTMIFKPDQPFSAGEHVEVTVDEGLQR